MAACPDTFFSEECMTTYFPSRAHCAPWLAACALMATGCASVTPDGGFDSVARIAADRLGKDARINRSEADRRTLQALIDARLNAPLQADDAVQIALLNNRALQATYWEVGIAEADLVQAGRLPNPSFSFLRTRAGSDIETGRTLGLNFVAALTLPLSRRIEAGRFEQTRLLVANQMMLHAAATRRAYIEAVAAVQSAAYAAQVDEAARLSAELTGRMTQAGNASQLDLARQQAFQAESAAALARADQAATTTREALATAMGLARSTYQLPPRLPDLPAAARNLGDVEGIALRERLDIQAAQLKTAQTASTLGLTRTTRFINVLDLDYVRNGKAGERTAPGYAITLEVPLFDWGGARVARAEAVYMQEVNRVAQAAVQARSEARLAYQAYRGAYDLARQYRDQVIPLRKKISDETMLRYNGMLVSVFDLLADARDQAAAANAYIDAEKNFWLADAQLDAALGGRLSTAQGTP
jgi:outer membrane protein TolC